MNKLLKYFLVLSLVLPMVVVSASAQTHLKKHVISNGSMVMSENGTSVRSSGTYGQMIGGKLEAYGTTNTGDLYVGFWEPVVLVGVEEDQATEVASIKNYPNPASTNTTITYELPGAANVSLKIYDNSGRLLKVIYSGFQNAGVQKVEYDLSDSFGRKLSSGSYMYELSATPYNAARGGFSPVYLRNAMIISK